MSIIRMNLGPQSYDIIIQRGVLEQARKKLNLDRKVIIVTDSGVPEKYINTVKEQVKQAVVKVFPSGEKSKTLETFQEILSLMLQEGFSRHDCVVAVGGGVPGDIAGFAAACYMRGIDFYNIPTTLLAQVDSSIGGKTAVNLNHVKNIVGAFYQPRAVLIDPDVLSTLPTIQVASGLAEAFKMACTSDQDFFNLFITGDPYEQIDTIIEKSLLFKRSVVQQDEKESGLRKVLNFGHTIGHGIEATLQDATLQHGQCVALGMLPMCSPQVRDKLKIGLKKMGIPTKFHFDTDAVCQAISHDKKSEFGSISTVFVPEVGKFEFRSLRIDQIRALLPIIQA